MDLLIVYSEKKKGELVSLASLLHEKDLRFQPLELPQRWSLEDSEDFYQYMVGASHWLFLLNAEDLVHPAFLFASGYCVAIHERCFVLEITGGFVPGYWKSLFTVCPDFFALVNALDNERHRWELFLARLDAKGKLVERGLEVTNSSFIEAVEKGDLISCELFLQAGFSPDLANKKGVSILGLAVRCSHLGVVRLLGDGGADVNLLSGDRDNSPLMDAAAEGLTEIVQELVDRGASLEGLSRNGQNVLVLAIGKGAQEVAGILLEAGADPFVPDKLGMNACQYAQLLGRGDFLDRVKSKFPDRL